MAPFLRCLNRFLPFATPGTPLLQDILHLTALCVLLYFAPHIQQRLEEWRARDPEAEVVAQTDDMHDRTQLNGELPAEIQHALHNHPDEEENVLEHDNQDAQNAPQDLPANAHLPVGNGQPGPANFAATRNVGAKKAKSLARKDQRRAYNEFMRSQGDAQRARDAEGATERETALSAERERRKLIEKDLQSRKAQERDAKKEREDHERRENARRTKMVLDIVKDELDSRRMCNLFKVAEAVGDDIDEEWVERVLVSSGMVGKTGEATTIITQTGWIAVVTAEDMKAVYQAAITENIGDEDGQITTEEIAVLLEIVLKDHAESET